MLILERLLPSLFPKCTIRSDQSFSCVRLCNPWIAARQASLSITNFWSLPKLMSIESVMPFNHLILCRPLLPLPSIFPSIRVFSNESALQILSCSFINLFTVYLLLIQCKQCEKINLTCFVNHRFLVLWRVCDVW